MDGPISSVRFFQFLKEEQEGRLLGWGANEIILLIEIISHGLEFIKNIFNLFSPISHFGFFFPYTKTSFYGCSPLIIHRSSSYKFK